MAYLERICLFILMSDVNLSKLTISTNIWVEDYITAFLEAV